MIEFKIKYLNLFEYLACLNLKANNFIYEFRIYQFYIFGAEKWKALYIGNVI